MKTRTKKFYELRATAMTRQDELLVILTGDEENKVEARVLTDDEQTEWDELDGEVTRLTNQIKAIEKTDAIRKDEPTPELGGEEKEKAEIKKRFSFIRAINIATGRATLDGVEKEMHDEAVAEAQRSGIAIVGVGVPVMIKDPAREQRDLVAVASAASAGNLIETSLDPEMILALRPRFITRELGATFMTGLTGNMDIPRQTGVAVAAWAGENATATEQTQTTELIQLRPNRLAAFTDVSTQLLIQSSPDAEAFVRNDLTLAVQTAVDLAALNGSGSGNEPTGILNTTGVNNIFANGDVAWDEIIALESKIANDNADVMNMNYVSTPGVRGELKATLKTVGVSGYIWESDTIQGGNMNGYGAFATTQMPNDLGGTNDNHAMIFGNWVDLIIAQWGGLDLLVNPFTKGKEGLVEVIVNSFWDVQLRRPQSFAHIKDILVTGNLGIT